MSVTNPDEVAYDAPESTSENVTLDSADGKETVNFAFTHTRTASVTGKAFVDEAAQDKMYTANEPALEGMEIPLTLQGPDVNREVDGKIGMDGSYAFEGLRAGTYRVLVDLTAEVRDGLEEAGYEFAGDVVGEKVTVAAGGMETVNFPFRITMQTISVSANMGSADGAAVAGVELALYANADMTGMLDEEQMTNEMGVAVFNFARAMNTGPGGNDNLVFVNMKSVGADNDRPRGFRQRGHRSLLPRCCKGPRGRSGCHAVEHRRQHPVLGKEQHGRPRRRHGPRRLGHRVLHADSG